MNELPSPTFALSQIAMPRRAVQPRICPLPAAVVPAAAKPAAGKVSLSWARHQDEVRQAQRLRYAVFALEMGATLPVTVPGCDIDLFDDYCKHLLVRALNSGEVIGTYRVLTPTQAKRVGSTYSDTEFDLTRLRALRSRRVELGRSCVHAKHRHGGVTLALWGALAEFMERNRLDTMMGCVSMAMQHNGVNTGQAAASIWRQVKQTHLAPIEYRVTPRLALPVVANSTTRSILSHQR